MRSWITIVPASRSPIRRERRSITEQTSATAPVVDQISNIAITARSTLWRTCTGPPSSRTTRVPITSRPTERPRSSSSLSTG